MKLRVLVEGKSEKALLDPWLARLLPAHTCVVLPHEGKGRLPEDLDATPDPRRRGLLDQLPAKLRAFAKSGDPGADAFVILVDADEDECVALRERIAQVAEECAPRLNVVVRIAIEETEAFYLGDLRALKKAFPKARLQLLARHVPDAIVGTWELFQHVIDAEREDKVRWAEAMAPHLTIEAAKSTSPSFRKLVEGLRRAVGDPRVGSKPARRTKRKRS